MVLERKYAIEEAITFSVRNTLEAEGMWRKLKDAVPSANLTDDSAKELLSELTSLAASKAIEKVMQWAHEHDLSTHWEALDRSDMITPALMEITNESTTKPDSSVPATELKNHLLAQKRKEVDRLQTILSEEENIIADLKRQVDEQEGITRQLKENVDATFKDCIQKLENDASDDSLH
ncbi:hypothetical protein BWQ96_01818 [Gracilariopsis chorda]|uniref:Uncharacterized protein n=1 Tax=Gracilariopsis chorda TaxID=448386 RepID=A0A2V3J1T4_9FLOR|nr:hypothetical protein BWQ96_01818 [Gracilariopsis chorda]|eukprot:PXF48358.1 hypothetical protein BWQ96_01818 [Gracilariopsis chorda]